MSTQPEALLHAEWLEKSLTIGAKEAAAELRRLHAVNADLLESLQEVFVIGDRLVSDVYGGEFVEKARAAIAKATEAA